MKTEKLYEQDCLRSRFFSRVTLCRPQEAGYAIALEATAFFPGGGGQAPDLGTLNGMGVEQVWEEQGEIFHLCPAPLAPGTRVEGILDWDRRFDLMQQHTGEHILSGLLFARYGYHNVGFHIGREVMTIDFDGPLPPEDLPALELAANQAVWQNLPVRCWYPETLEGLAYRSKKALEMPVRIVEIPGVDRCACCGVHVASTGQVGLIKLLSWGKFHQGVRLELVCGGRALAYVQGIFEQNRQVSQAFSARPMETGAAALEKNRQLAAEKYRSLGLERRLFQQLARDYRGKPLALCFQEELSPGSLRTLAEILQEASGGVAAVFSGGNFCLAGPPEQVKALGKEMAAALQARGGGKPGYFQGSLPAEEPAVRAFFGERC